MKKIELADLRNLDEYERTREDFRRKVIELKKRRRVQVGPKVSLLFENRETVLFQIQEMVRTERLVARERVQEEIDVYNTLIPQEGELSATLFIEIEDARRLPQELPGFVGIENAVSLHIGSRSIAALPDETRSKDDTTSTVHYLRFRLNAEEQQALRSGQEKALVVINHPNYSQAVEIDEVARSELSQDLA